jgi:hypothetical protein
MTPTYSCQRFGLLQDQAQVGCVAVSAFGTRGEDTEAMLATSFSARVAFGTAIDATPTKASRRMNQIKLLARMIIYLQRRNTEPAGLAKKHIPVQKKGVQPEDTCGFRIVAIGRTS